MVPIPPAAPSKRKTLRLKAAERLTNPLAPRKVHRPNSVVDDAFLETKRDKQLIKHSAFVSRIASSSSAADLSSHPTKDSSNRVSKAAHKNARRHAVAADKKRQDETTCDLGSLSAALPELTADEVRDGQLERAGRLVPHKSLASKRGALRRKERVVRAEMAHFRRSYAHMSTIAAEIYGSAKIPAAPESSPAYIPEVMDGIEAVPTPQYNSATANRFAALRESISATMEQNPAFAGQQ